MNTQPDKTDKEAHKPGTVGFARELYISMTTPLPAPQKEPETATGRPKLITGHVYRDSDDGNLFVCAEDTPDGQMDVLVVNFHGGNGYAHYELCEGDEDVAPSLEDYIATLSASAAAMRKALEDYQKSIAELFMSAWRAEQPIAEALMRAQSNGAKALSSDAGKGGLSPEDAERLRGLLSTISEIVQGDPTTFERRPDVLVGAIKLLRNEHDEVEQLRAELAEAKRQRDEARRDEDQVRQILTITTDEADALQKAVTRLKKEAYELKRLAYFGNPYTTLNWPGITWKEVADTMEAGALHHKRESVVLRDALSFYTRNGPLGKDAWIETADDHGHVWGFDYPGDVANNPWEIAETAISGEPVKLVGGWQLLQVPPAIWDVLWGLTEFKGTSITQVLADAVNLYRLQSKQENVTLEVTA